VGEFRYAFLYAFCSTDILFFSLPLPLIPGWLAAAALLFLMSRASKNIITTHAVGQQKNIMKLKEYYWFFERLHVVVARLLWRWKQTTDDDDVRERKLHNPSLLL